MADVTADDDLPASIREYATTLHHRLLTAWAAARDATLDAQSDTVGDTTRTKDTHLMFLPGERVCRRKPGHANKLEYDYTGPYRRVEAALGAGKYSLRDLENKLVKGDIHISNLKPYYTITDLEPVEQDEYLIDSLLDRRGLGRDRHYLVKWRGFSRKEATWEPRTELMRRCADLVDAFDLQPAQKPKLGKSSPTVFPTRPTTPKETMHDTPAFQDREAGRFSLRKRAPVKYKETKTKVNAIYHPVQAYTTAAPVIEYKPLSATFMRGEWYYHVTNAVNTPHWPSQTFSPQELSTPPFQEAKQNAEKKIGSYDLSLCSDATYVMCLDGVSTYSELELRPIRKLFISPN